jgi:hypothetical protein
VLNDPRLQLDRVEHRSLAGCSMHNLGSGQRVAAGRGGGAEHRVGRVLSGFAVVGERLCVAGLGCRVAGAQTCRWWLTTREFDVATWHARMEFLKLERACPPDIRKSDAEMLHGCVT